MFIAFFLTFVFQRDSCSIEERGSERWPIYNYPKLWHATPVWRFVSFRASTHYSFSFAFRPPLSVFLCFPRFLYLPIFLFRFMSVFLSLFSESLALYLLVYPYFCVIFLFLCELIFLNLCLILFPREKICTRIFVYLRTHKPFFFIFVQ